MLEVEKQRQREGEAGSKARFLSFPRLPPCAPFREGASLQRARALCSPGAARRLGKRGVAAAEEGPERGGKLRERSGSRSFRAPASRRSPPEEGYHLLGPPTQSPPRKEEALWCKTCPSGAFGDCKGAFKIIGPLLAVVGLVCIILAQSRAKDYLRNVQLQDDQVYGFVFCRGNCQFAQFLVFGFLFLTSGMLISVLGIWIPGCSPGWRYQQFNHSNTSSIELQDCGFHSVQTMGPLIVLIGLCFFVIAHIKKKQNLTLIQESSVSEEEQLNSESFQVTVGDTVMVFPPPPPPYFSDCSLQTVTPSLVSSEFILNENPPPYHSIFMN
ncbi:transmembrane protein 171 [Python bivittatus]|uniref:Transmembrane protein 171 n=1 Tax=Python bivittatus TaxID=176946 RepID=A0A9F5IFX3_PYTBI|nr:transmembrane protein 171 [Python bivittatus]